mmetsp:Transcript_80634/g.215251  ORF Transcript_80634/g.215251 Transcript_80634/m.215251 type:complete len:250 (-) Transcript_80634:174-923(-)
MKGAAFLLLARVCLLKPVPCDRFVVTMVIGGTLVVLALAGGALWLVFHVRNFSCQSCAPCGSAPGKRMYGEPAESGDENPAPGLAPNGITPELESSGKACFPRLSPSGGRPRYNGLGDVESGLELQRQRSDGPGEPVPPPLPEGQPLAPDEQGSDMGVGVGLSSRSPSAIQPEPPSEAPPQLSPEAPQQLTPEAGDGWKRALAYIQEAQTVKSGTDSIVVPTTLGAPQEDGRRQSITILSANGGTRDLL